MQADPFDEEAFFGAIARSGTRALLIGRRALIALGVPVLTADYDFWIHIDDIERLNGALEPQGFVPNHAPDMARRRGRYVLENGERVDVLIARVHPTVDGAPVAFDDVWARRQVIAVAADVKVALPSTADLIATKRFGARPKDAEDIRALEEMLRGNDD
jgi:hypothetical protein